MILPSDQMQLNMNENNLLTCLPLFKGANRHCCHRTDASWNHWLMVYYGNSSCCLVSLDELNLESFSLSLRILCFRLSVPSCISEYFFHSSRYKRVICMCRLLSLTCMRENNSNWGQQKAKKSLKRHSMSQGQDIPQVSFGVRYVIN